MLMPVGSGSIQIDNGKRSPLWVRFTTSTAGIAEGAAGQVADADSSLSIRTGSSVQRGVSRQLRTT